MSRQIMIFSGVIFIIVFGVFEIVLISIVEPRDAITIFNGILGLMGGVIGATTAYFIASVQINKQDSNRIVDLKLDKYEVIGSRLQNILIELVSLQNELDDILNSSDLKNRFSSDAFLKSRQEKEKRIKKNLEELIKLKIYFKLMKLDSEKNMNILKWETNYVLLIDNEYASEEVDDYHELMNNLQERICEIADIKQAIEEETEKLLIR